jgi:hypothetical protein
VNAAFIILLPAAAFHGIVPCVAHLYYRKKLDEIYQLFVDGAILSVFETITVAKSFLFTVIKKRPRIFERQWLLKFL